MVSTPGSPTPAGRGPCPLGPSWGEGWVKGSEAVGRRGKYRSAHGTNDTNDTCSQGQEHARGPRPATSQALCVLKSASRGVTVKARLRVTAQEDEAIPGRWLAPGCSLRSLQEKETEGHHPSVHRLKAVPVSFCSHPELPQRPGLSERGLVPYWEHVLWLHSWNGGGRR